MTSSEPISGHAQSSARIRDICLGLALLLSLFAAFPLFAGAGVVNTRAGGDVPFMWQRVHELSQNLRAGVFPARWMPNAAYGLGYPAFNYYASLPYYVAALLNLCGCGILLGIQMVQLLGFLLAGWAVYCLAEELGAKPPAALLSSALYTFAPFHLVNVYVRGDSLAEFWAMAVFPLTVWCMLRLVRRPNLPRLVALGAAFAALVLSHNISAMILSPWLGIWALIRAWQARREQGLCPLIYGAGALALGLMLSIWFWAPALRETSLVQLGDQTSGFFDYAGHFRGADLLQWRWLFNYGLGVKEDPFRMGLVQCLFGLAGVIGAAILWRNRPEKRSDGAILLGALVLYTWLITPLSSSVWEHVPFLDYCQFPWRMLGPQALALALLAGLAAESFPGRGQILVPALVLGVVASSMIGLDPGRIPVREGDLTTERFMLYEMYTDNIGGTVRAEYLPRDMVPRPYTSGVQLAGGETPLPLVLEGTIVSASLREQGPTDQAWQVVVGEKALVGFQTTFFSGWEAIVDGQAQGVEPLDGLGLIGVRLEPGEHLVRLYMGNTPTRRLANWISLLGLLVAAGLLVAHAVKHPRAWRPLAAGLGCVAMVILWVSLAPQPARAISRDGLYVMDFGWAPYPHYEPQGIIFDRESDQDQVYTHLLSCDQSATQLAPGDTLVIRLEWAQVDPGHKVRLRLQSALAHHASRSPHWSEVVVKDLEAGERSVDVPLPDDMPPGVYVVALSVRQQGDGMPCETYDGNGMHQVALAPITVTGHRQATGQESVLAEYGPPNAPVAISLVGVAGELVDEDMLQATLTWRSESQAPLNYQLSLRLYDADGIKMVSRDLAPLLGGYPTSLWRTGELISDRVWLKFEDEYAFTGKERLEVVLYDVRTLQGAGLASIGLSKLEQ